MKNIREVSFWKVAAEILHYLLEIANHFSTLFTRVPSSLAEHFNNQPHPPI
jgi:hypothetical protein